MYVRNFLLRGWGGREIGAEGGGSGEVRGEGREGEQGSRIRIQCQCKLNDLFLGRICASLELHMVL